MKCLIIGICQLNAIAQILKNNAIFNTLYDEIIIHVIFQLSELEMTNILQNIVPSMDLILSQPVSKNYKNSNIYSTFMLKSFIKPGTKHLIITNCYFTGYDPLPFQLVQENGDILNHHTTYYPLLSFNSILANDYISASKNWCNPKAYTKKIIQNNLQQSLQELEKREDRVFDENYDIDIKIADFIKNNYQDFYLFHTYNHPTNIILIEITKRILTKLKLPIILNNNYTEFLGDISLPPCPAVYINLECKFPYPLFVFNNKKYETRDAMKYLTTDIQTLDHNLYDKWGLICKEKNKYLYKYDI